MASGDLLVVVDDTDPRITYSTSWSIDHGEQDTVGDYGLTYNGTQHVTNTNATQFQFAFVGTEFKLYGRSDYVNTANGTFRPALNCVVDGTPVNLVRPLVASANNQILCWAGFLSEGVHQVEGTVITAGQALWLDYVVYTTNQTSQNDTLVIDDTDRSITYSDGWNLKVFPDNAVRLTQKHGTTMKFNFIGTGITWYGGTSPGSSSDTAPVSASGAYSIDGGVETTFIIPWTAKTQLYQPLFSVVGLSTGSHSLAVTYEGDETQAPLMLDYLIVLPNIDNSDSTTTHVPSASTTSDITSSSPSIGSGDRNSTASPPTGAIIGAAVGGAALIIGLILLWLMYRKRSSASRVPPTRMSLIQDDTLVLPEPFITSPVEPGAVVTSHPSSPSMRQVDSTVGITATDFSRSSSPALRSSFVSSSPYERVHSVTSGSSRIGPASSAKVEAASRLRLVDHEDSGSRFTARGGKETVVDVPPGYTEK